MKSRLRLAVLLLVATACGRSGAAAISARATTTTTTLLPTVASEPSTSTAATSSTTERPVPATTVVPPSVASATANLTDADNGRTVAVTQGTRITVTLGSTYWVFAALSDNGVLRQQGEVSYSPAPGCVPGGGCGTVALTVVAVGAGEEDVVASRTSCGEALRCTGNQGSYRTTVTVSP
jgi:hypothetical protein